MFSLTYAWINGWVNNREAGDYYDVIVMESYANCTHDLDIQLSEDHGIVILLLMLFSVNIMITYHGAA